MAKRKPPSVVTRGYNPIENLKHFAHPPKTKKVAGRAPTKLVKSKNVKAPLNTAGGSAVRVAREMGHRKSYRIK